MYAKILILIS